MRRLKNIKGHHVISATALVGIALFALNLSGAIMVFANDSPKASHVMVPGGITGTGTHFEIRHSDYLNLEVSSSEEIKTEITSIPETVTMFIEPVSSAATTQISISGLTPLALYFKFEDDYHNVTPFITDSTGRYIYTQEVSQPHLVFIQPRLSTKFITDNPTGGDCASIGIWDNFTKTCILTTNVFETIQIDDDNITLDGNGHTVEGTNTGSGIFVNSHSGVTIKNVIAKHFTSGINFVFSQNSTVANSNATLNSSGIHFFFSESSTLSDNTASDNTFGILHRVSDNGVLSNNIMNDNIFNFFVTGTQDSHFSSNTIDTTNTVDGKLIFYVKNSTGVVFDTSFNIGTLYCINCENIIVKDLILTKNGHGILFWKTSNSQIENINANLNNSGIQLLFSNNNSLVNNTLESNRIAGVLFNDSNNNEVYNNNFIANLNQAFVFNSVGNLFDLSLPIGGNYWSDFDMPAEGCSDTNDDGICDDPRIFSGGQDNSPWTTQDGWLATTLLNVPLYTQRISNFPSQIETGEWDNELYANGRGNLGGDPCGLNIEQCGCAITSAVMIARFYDVTQAQGNEVNPLTLDSWLNDNNGYTDNGELIWNSLNHYTNFQVEYVESDDTPDNFSLLDHHLFDQEPLIAKAFAGRGDAVSHFFVIDGKRADNSYSVKDPYWYNTQNLTEGITDGNLALRDYEGGFDGLRIYKKGDGIAKASLSIFIGSPVELLLTDPLGRHIGTNPATGETFDEIPSGSYFADSIGDPTGVASPTGHTTKTIYIAEPEDGSYNVQITGTDIGTHSLAMQAVNNQGILFEINTSGVTASGTAAFFETSFSTTTTEFPPLFKEVSFATLRQDIQIALELGIIDNRGVANSLLQKLDSAKKNIQKNKTQTAQNILNALKQEISAQKGKHMHELFASVLLQDVDTLSNSLPGLALSFSSLLAGLYSVLSQLLEFLSRL